MVYVLLENLKQRSSCTGIEGCAVCKLSSPLKVEVLTGAPGKTRGENQMFRFFCWKYHL